MNFKGVFSETGFLSLSFFPFFDGDQDVLSDRERVAVTRSRRFLFVGFCIRTENMLDHTMIYFKFSEPTPVDVVVVCEPTEPARVCV